MLGRARRERVRVGRADGGDAGARGEGSRRRSDRVLRARRQQRPDHVTGRDRKSVGRVYHGSANLRQNTPPGIHRQAARHRAANKEGIRQRGRVQRSRAWVFSLFWRSRLPLNLSTSPFFPKGVRCAARVSTSQPDERIVMTGSKDDAPSNLACISAHGTWRPTPHQKEEAS